MKREEILKLAIDATTGPRQEKYGPPVVNFANIAALWNAWIDARWWVLTTERRNMDLQIDLGPEDVAVMNILQKVARLAHTIDHVDSAVDIAAYAAILAELGTE